MYMAAAPASLGHGHETYAYTPAGSSGFVPDGGGLCSAAENCGVMMHFPPPVFAVDDDYGFPELGVHPPYYSSPPPQVFSKNETMNMSSVDEWSMTTTTTSRATGNGQHHRHRRIGFRTRSEVDVLDDGFRWRKYGKKAVKSSPNPRNYYRCCVEGCGVKKRVERDRDDPRYVLTTYDGVHNHAAAPPAAALATAPSTLAWPMMQQTAHSSESSYSR